MLKGKKIIIFGDGGEIGVESLKRWLEAADAEVVLGRQDCFS